MLTVVLIINVMMALFCMIIAWRVWILRRVFRQAADALITAEKSTHAVLYRAPESIYNGQMSVHQLREQYQQLEPQLRQARQLLTLLSLGQIVWPKRSLLRSSRRSQRY
jgi:hypothetical protein